MTKKPDRNRLALAKIEGLTLSDCLNFFDEKDERAQKIIDLCEVEDEGFEIDTAHTSEGEDNGAYVMGWRWVSFSGVEGFDKDEACPDCGAIEGTPEWGTVGDGFDGYCPSCADKREESGEVEVG